MSQDIARIQKCLEIVAILTAEDEVYLPIFQRLEKELEKAKNPKPDALTRARIAAERAKAKI